MKEEVFYSHTRTTAFNKDYTICGKVVGYPFAEDAETGELFNEYELHIGVAVCSDEDMFVKSTGREVALEHATTNPLVIIKLTSENSLHQFLEFTNLFTPKSALRKSITIKETYV